MPQSYGLQELFDKKLWFLLPFHIFGYEPCLKESESNAEKRRELSNVFREVRTRMDDLCSSGQMNEYQKYRIIFCARMVAEKLMEKKDNKELFSHETIRKYFMFVTIRAAKNKYLLQGRNV